MTRHINPARVAMFALRWNVTEEEAERRLLAGDTGGGDEGMIRSGTFRTAQCGGRVELPGT